MGLKSVPLVYNLILLLKWLLWKPTWMHFWIFPEFYQTVFLKAMNLNISIFFICSVLTFWETGKALPSGVKPLSGVRFQCQPTRQTSHVARMTPENPFGKQTLGDGHMSLIKTYKARSSSSFGSGLPSVLGSTRWNSCFLFSCCIKNMGP